MFEFFNRNFLHCENIFEKNQVYKCKTISIITKKILEYNMEYCSKNIFKIRNYSSIFQNK